MTEITWDDVARLDDPVRVMGQVAAHAVEDEQTGCWEWQRALKPSGYGQLWCRVGGKLTVSPAHRAAWMAFRSDIPSPLVVDHLCRNRACCNPWHLELVTTKVNTNRGVHWRRGCARHGLDDGYYLPRKQQPEYVQWVCRSCGREANDRRRAKRATARGSAA